MTTATDLPYLEDVPNLARPFARHRLRIYLSAAVFLGLLWPGLVVLTATRVLPPTMTVDVVANILLAVPLILVPFVVFWTRRGEYRHPLERAAEITLVWLPFTASGQTSYELIFLGGHLAGIWDPTEDPGWKWFWWQFAEADTRYWGENPYIFGMEAVAVVAGFAVMICWTGLLRTDLSDESRVRHLSVAAVGNAALYAGTLIYFISSARNGFGDIEQGAYGLGLKFLGLAIPYFIIPPFVMVAIQRQINFLNRRIGAREALLAQREAIGASD